MSKNQTPTILGFQPTRKQEKVKQAASKRRLLIGVGIMSVLLLVAASVWFAAFRHPKKVVISGLPLEMILVSATSKHSTGNDDYNDVTDPYYMADTEVTYKQWKTVYDWAVKHGYTFINQGQPGSDRENGPVTHVSWWDCIAWCNALTEYCNATQGTKYTCVYRYNGVVARNLNYFGHRAVNADIASKGFRLPLSEEWELARCVEAKSPNALGVYGLNGKVREWCYNGCLNHQGSIRIDCGILWYCDENSILRIVKVGGNSPLYVNGHLGFRIAKSL